MEGIMKKKEEALHRRIEFATERMIIWLTKNTEAT